MGGILYGTPISRVLSWATIYLGVLLPVRSSGYRCASEQLRIAHLLAADRVYLYRMLPCATVGSYPTHFTLTPPALTLKRHSLTGRYCFCGTFPRVTSGRR